MADSTRSKSNSRLLKLYLEQTPDHAVICLGADGTIVGWLGAAQEIFGYTQAEAVGQPGSLIFTASDRKKGFDQYELAVARQNSRSDDDRWHVRKDGTHIWVSGSVNAIKTASGELLGYVKVVRDKTDLRSHIQALENESQALKEAQQRADLFMSTLGHELRNPLAPLQSSAHIIKRVSADPQVQRAVQVIDRQIGVLSRLTHDLMEVSRVVAGKLQLTLRRVDVRQVLADAVYSMRQTAVDRGIELESLLPDSPLEVQLDAERFERVVLNLLSNALKYTPRGGTVWVKATQEGSEVLLRVEDTGQGIAPEVLPRIFDLFTQEQRNADQVPTGLGIGLSIVKELVELHGGKVQARSAGAGKGAEFTVRLPAAGA